MEEQIDNAPEVRGQGIRINGQEYVPKGQVGDGAQNAGEAEVERRSGRSSVFIDGHSETDAQGDDASRARGEQTVNFDEMHPRDQYLYAFSRRRTRNDDGELVPDISDFYKCRAYDIDAFGRF